MRAIRCLLVAVALAAGCGRAEPTQPASAPVGYDKAEGRLPVDALSTEARHAADRLIVRLLKGRLTAREAPLATRSLDLKSLAAEWTIDYQTKVAHGRFD